MIIFCVYDSGFFLLKDRLENLFTVHPEKSVSNGLS